MSSETPPLTIAYQADLDDFAEPATRQFLRGKTARQQRILSTIIGGVFPGLFILLVFRTYPLEPLIFGAAVGGAVGAAINFFRYKSRVRKRIRKYYKREYGTRIPSETIFEVRPARFPARPWG